MFVVKRGRGRLGGSGAVQQGFGYPGQLSDPRAVKADAPPTPVIRTTKAPSVKTSKKKKKPKKRIVKKKKTTKGRPKTTSSNRNRVKRLLA